MSLMYARPSFREFFLSIHFLLNRSACCAPTHSRALGDPWAVTLASSSVLIGTRVFFYRAIVENVTVSDCATRVRVLVVVQPLWGPLTNKSEGRRWFSVFWKAVLGRPTIWRLTHFSTTLDRSMRPGDQWEIFAEWIVDITRCRIITSCTICCAAFSNRRHPSRTRIGQVRHARKLRRTPAEGEIHGQLRPENSSIRLMWGRQRRLYDGRNHFVVFLCPILKSCRVSIHLGRWEAVTTISREKMKRWPKNVVKWLSISKKVSSQSRQFGEGHDSSIIIALFLWVISHSPVFSSLFSAVLQLPIGILVSSFVVFVFSAKKSIHDFTFR